MRSSLAALAIGMALVILSAAQLNNHHGIRRRQMMRLGVAIFSQGEKAVVVQEAVIPLLPSQDYVDVFGIGGVEGAGATGRAV